MFISVVTVSGKVFLHRLRWLIAFLIPALVSGQSATSDSVLQNATLENVVRYAIERNPDLKNALLDERITETMIRERLADWLPQVGLNYSYQRNFQLPRLISITSLSGRGLATHPDTFRS
jgi:outer membrane protein TolC